MPSVATFMMPAHKCVTAVPEDKLSSVVESLVKERIGCVAVVDPSDNRAVGIVTKQDVNRLFLKQVSARAGASAPARERTRAGDAPPPLHFQPRTSRLETEPRARCTSPPPRAKEQRPEPRAARDGNPPVLRESSARTTKPNRGAETVFGDESSHYRTRRHTRLFSPLARTPPEPRRPPWTLP